ncbi:MAG: hypothetical protein NC548_57620 [Lachnospiraceae bacterium]|nr:hypothetical protein [Lachnospiraceae bacterium]
MANCKKSEAFTLLLFTTVKRMRDLSTGEDVELESEKTAEVAAVKIEKGQIAKHFSSFIALENYDMQGLEFTDLNFNLNGIGAEHLIGAPSLREVAEKIKAFVGEDTVIVKGDGERKSHPYRIFMDGAKRCGVEFENPTVDIDRIYDAMRLRNLLDDEGKKFEDATPIEIARTLAPVYDNWTDIFLYNDVYFDPSDGAYMRARNDLLSWALAFAKFFIKIVDWDDDASAC